MFLPGNDDDSATTTVARYEYLYCFIRVANRFLYCVDRFTGDYEEADEETITTAKTTKTEDGAAAAATTTTTAR